MLGIWKSGGEEMSFKVGDEVFLKSGGPKMTVIDPNWNKQSGRVKCQWWSSKEDTYKTGIFAEEVLTPSLGAPGARAV